ncbi:isoleucyl-tRNA synthetase [Geosmithia morbida]|uniref:Isoleucine--tRNA ligase, mitochondrial n=1 Tax=Geosmithia morbida TaxID=1094350 RepID=A0A9P5D6S8_9HYPO|nr:isoleucyl-tRNA synthetase [Geosmithia morbida]KAF4125075.1 isoleucyl-tRNA synthetase [Geosmithia morbida]
MSKSWKSTLKLPTSTFPARPNPKFQQQYLQQCTDDLYAWQSTQRKNDDDPFVLHDGPPYANGPLHIGHSINKILKDMIVRNQVQRGRRVVYRPGWDCHGLPIEMKALGTGNGKGMSPVKIRDQAKRLASKTVTDQLKGFKSFGVMSDWDARWTTMDHAYEMRQLRVFQKLVRHGLIYRKHKPVYWSTSTRTALAEAELEYRDDHQSLAAYVKYLIEEGASAVPGLEKLQGPLYAAIWTTTPWTLPANKVIAVHNDIRYSVLQLDGYGVLVAGTLIDAVKKFAPDAAVVAEDIPGSSLVGLRYRNKLRGSSAPTQPIIHADFVTADSGTGLVHVAPGHGQDDYEACAQIGIEAFAPIDDDGHFTAEAFPEDPERLTSAPTILDGGSQAVLDIVADDVIGTETLRHKYPYDWRTKQPVVTRATAQWFADVGSIKDDALQALRKVRFVPKSGRNRLENFIKGRSEWCISRQRSWGVPIPALYDADGDSVMTEDSIEHIIGVMQQRTSQAWFSDAPDEPAWIPASLRQRGKTYRRGTDTMDVWFDSGSSWTETAGPADVYLEGSDQHRGWFQSSLLTYVAEQKADGKTGTAIDAPFKTLITHGFTLDDHGKKMSKSLGNTLAPSQVMDGTLLPPLKTKGKGPPKADALGADALRLWVAMTDFTKDMLIGPSVLQPVHSSLIKYRTTLKMLVGSLHQSSRQAPLTKLDQIALMQLQDTMDKVSEAYRDFEFYQGVQIINRWLANDLSAFYLECLKDRLYCGDGGGVIEPIFTGFLRMLAPITPNLVEEAWAHRPQWMMEDGSSISPARQLYDAPLTQSERLDRDPTQLRQDWDVLSTVRDAVKLALESAREDKHVGSSLQCSVIVNIDGAEHVSDCLTRYADELEDIFVVSSVAVNPEQQQQQQQQQPAWSYEQAIIRDSWSGKVTVLPPVDHKCSRCWRYMAAEEEGLCTRCDEVVGALDS